MARILIGVSGGIAAYKGLELARLATARHAVRVVMTPTPALRRRRVVRGDHRPPVPARRVRARPDARRLPRRPAPAHDPIGHLAVVENADVFIVAPATANTIAKLAGGHGDSMLTTSFLACTAPRIVAPAMNDRMYRDARPRTTSRPCAARDHRDRAREGPLASRGEHGVGRLPAPERLLRESRRACRRRRALGRAAGARHRRRHPRADRLRALHRQPLQRPHGDRVAAAAARRGAEVTLVAANVACRARAAVAPDRGRDGRRARRGDPRGVRRGRRPGDGGRSRRLPPGGAPRARSPARAAAASSCGSRRPRTSSPPSRRGASPADVVGFAAEHGAEAIERAREKLERKGVDAIVFNDVSRARSASTPPRTR